MQQPEVTENTLWTDIAPSVQIDVCAALNETYVSGNDWREVSHRLGFGAKSLSFKQSKSPFEAVMKSWVARDPLGCTVGTLRAILEAMGRNDVAQLLPVVHAPVRGSFTLQGSPGSFPQAQFLEFLASVLKSSAKRFVVVEVKYGSVVIVIDIPFVVVEGLVKLLREGEFFRLALSRGFHVISATVAGYETSSGTASGESAILEQKSDVAVLLPPDCGDNLFESIFRNHETSFWEENWMVNVELYAEVMFDEGMLNYLVDYFRPQEVEGTTAPPRILVLLPAWNAKELKNVLKVDDEKIDDQKLYPKASIIRVGHVIWVNISPHFDVFCNAAQLLWLYLEMAIARRLKAFEGRIFSSSNFKVHFNPKSHHANEVNVLSHIAPKDDVLKDLIKGVVVIICNVKDWKKFLDKRSEEEVIGHYLVVSGFLEKKKVVLFEVKTYPLIGIFCTCLAKILSECSPREIVYAPMIVPFRCEIEKNIAGKPIPAKFKNEDTVIAERCKVHNEESVNSPTNSIVNRNRESDKEALWLDRIESFKKIFDGFDNASSAFDLDSGFFALGMKESEISLGVVRFQRTKKSFEVARKLISDYLIWLPAKGKEGRGSFELVKSLRQKYHDAGYESFRIDRILNEGIPSQFPVYYPQSVRLRYGQTLVGDVKKATIEGLFSSIPWSKLKVESDGYEKKWVVLESPSGIGKLVGNFLCSEWGGHRISLEQDCLLRVSLRSVLRIGKVSARDILSIALSGLDQAEELIEKAEHSPSFWKNVFLIIDDFDDLSNVADDVIVKKLNDFLAQKKVGFVLFLPNRPGGVFGVNAHSVVVELLGYVEDEDRALFLRESLSSDLKLVGNAQQLLARWSFSRVKSNPLFLRMLCCSVAQHSGAETPFEVTNYVLTKLVPRILIGHVMATFPSISPQEGFNLERVWVEVMIGLSRLLEPITLDNNGSVFTGSDGEKFSVAAVENCKWKRDGELFQSILFGMIREFLFPCSANEARFLHPLFKDFFFSQGVAMDVKNGLAVEKGSDDFLCFVFEQLMWQDNHLHVLSGDLLQAHLADRVFQLAAVNDSRCIALFEHLNVVGQRSLVSEVISAGSRVAMEVVLMAAVKAGSWGIVEHICLRSVKVEQKRYLRLALKIASINMKIVPNEISDIATLQGVNVSTGQMKLKLRQSTLMDFGKLNWDFRNVGMILSLMDKNEEFKSFVQMLKEQRNISALGDAITGAAIAGKEGDVSNLLSIASEFDIHFVDVRWAIRSQELVTVKLLIAREGIRVDKNMEPYLHGKLRIYSKDEAALMALRKRSSTVSYLAQIGWSECIKNVKKNLRKDDLKGIDFSSAMWKVKQGASSSVECIIDLVKSGADLCNAISSALGTGEFAVVWRLLNEFCPRNCAGNDVASRNNVDLFCVDLSGALGVKSDEGTEIATRMLEEERPPNINQKIDIPLQRSKSLLRLLAERGNVHLVKILCDSGVDYDHDMNDAVIENGQVLRLLSGLGYSFNERSGFTLEQWQLGNDETKQRMIRNALRTKCFVDLASIVSRLACEEMDAKENRWFKQLFDSLDAETELLGQVMQRVDLTMIAISGNVDNLGFLLTKGALVDTIEWKKVAERNCKEIVDKCVAFGASALKIDVLGPAKKGDANLVDYILELQMKEILRIRVERCAREDKVDLLRQLLVKPEAPNPASIDLSIPARFGKMNAVKELMKYRRDASGVDLAGVVEHGYFEVAEFLIRKGADPRHPLVDLSAIAAAPEKTHFKTLELIVKAMGDTVSADMIDLSGAARAGNAKSIDLLCDKIDGLLDKDVGKTVRWIVEAGKNGNLALVEKLINGTATSIRHAWVKILLACQEYASIDFLDRCFSKPNGPDWRDYVDPILFMRPNEADQKILLSYITKYKGTYKDVPYPYLNFFAFFGCLEILNACLTSTSIEAETRANLLIKWDYMLALSFASSNGHLKTLKVLLEFPGSFLGRSMNVATDHSRLAGDLDLYLTGFNGHMAVIDLLIYFERDISGALVGAAVGGHIKLVAELAPLCQPVFSDLVVELIHLNAEKGKNFKKVLDFVHEYLGVQSNLDRNCCKPKFGPKTQILDVEIANYLSYRKLVAFPKEFEWVRCFKRHAEVLTMRASLKELDRLTKIVDGGSHSYPPFEETLILCRCAFSLSTPLIFAFSDKYRWMWTADLQHWQSMENIVMRSGPFKGYSPISAHCRLMHQIVLPSVGVPQVFLEGLDACCIQIPCPLAKLLADGNANLFVVVRNGKDHTLLEDVKGFSQQSLEQRQGYKFDWKLQAKNQMKPDVSKQASMEVEAKKTNLSKPHFRIKKSMSWNK